MFIILVMVFAKAHGLTFNEQVIVSVAKELKVPQCVIEISAAFENSDFNLIKALSKNGIAATYWNSRDIDIPLKDHANNFTYLLGSNITSSQGWLARSGPTIMFVVYQNLLEDMFYMPTNAEDLTIAAYNMKRLVLRWSIYLILGPNNAIFTPFNTLTLHAFKISDDLYTIRNIYGVKDVIYDLPWGIWSKGTLFVTPQRRHMSGSVLRRLHLSTVETDKYVPYLSVLMPMQEMIVESAKLLNISYELTSPTDLDYFSYDLSDSVSAIIDRNFQGVCGPMLKFRLFMHIKWMGENPLERYFVHPFDEDLWIAIISWICLAMIAVTLIYFAAPENTVNDSIDNIVAVLEAFCCQGGSWDEKTASARLLRLATWLTVCVVIPSYTAVIISFMTVRIAQIPFTDFESLEENGRYKLSVEKHMLPMITAFASPRQLAILQKFIMSDDELPYSATESVAKICQGLVAHISYGDVIEKTQKSCQIIKIGKPIAVINTGMPIVGFQEGYKSFMDLLHRFRGNGMISRFQKNFDIAFDILDRPERIAVEMNLVKELFSIYCYVVGASLIVLGVEVMIWSICHKNVNVKRNKWAKRRKVTFKFTHKATI